MYCGTIDAQVCVVPGCPSFTFVLGFFCQSEVVIRPSGLVSPFRSLPHVSANNYSILFEFDGGKTGLVGTPKLLTWLDMSRRMYAAQTTWRTASWNWIPISEVRPKKFKSNLIWPEYFIRLNNSNFKIIVSYAPIIIDKKNSFLRYSENIDTHCGRFEWNIPQNKETGLKTYVGLSKKNVCEFPIITRNPETFWFSIIRWISEFEKTCASFFTIFHVQTQSIVHFWRYLVDCNDFLKICLGKTSSVNIITLILF